MAEKSYVPVEDLKFPLIIFENPIYCHNNLNNDPKLKHLFSIRNIFLNTKNENFCNWMIHVTPAFYSNEQNLMCYQLHNQIYFTAIQDIDVGDILKVWYAPNYAKTMNKKLLVASPYNIVNNVLKQVSISTYDSIVEHSLSNCQFQYYKNNKFIPEVTLPPINSLMKQSCQKFVYENYLTEPDQPNNVSNFNETHATDVDNDNNLNLSDFIISMNNNKLDKSNKVRIDEVNNNNNEKVLPNTIKMKLKSNKSININKSAVNFNQSTTYECNICTKSYMAVCNLNKHMKTHNLYMCDLCMKVTNIQKQPKIT